MTHWETIWQFQTANFCVTCDVAPEEMDPADSFCCQDDIDAVRTGAVDWFMVRVQVSLGANVLGEDYLGGCAYRNASDFARGADRDGYFRDVVRAVIGDARKKLSTIRLLGCREVA